MIKVSFKMQVQSAPMNLVKVHLFLFLFFKVSGVGVKSPPTPKFRTPALVAVTLGVLFLTLFRLMRVFSNPIGDY